jgi:hypothetical protein
MVYLLYLIKKIIKYLKHILGAHVEELRLVHFVMDLITEPNLNL